ncbi:class Ib ribonucleoside-diphosphate reductase assembly flavoprotein NrdI [Apilactobacillus sp. TMW 2.2459]|uniref:class Ib ribonucleoside-diphosphate reductase assembly flavoprotein NrdI n=1 Tax=Apilactobacillus xinyiensis TaxID=2841032 RepID=UPI0020105553|nr:class Ib ribonucleoside-diphosphate reductase assembly flavoprotein NrdI [Apilactobacillus xinyiensis]MCL0312546.1 class Ib ribonucleoside-diphosphate reductase assembly flavoprotein NrdI [Apilactobacillus xinyiensis]
MEKINVLYISIEGNTKNFIKNLSEYAKNEHNQDEQKPVINAKEISEQTDFSNETDNFFAFVPTYLDGGNGIDNGVKELMTNVLGEYIHYNNNARKCIGVVGSGNRNFNEQYCLTARRYAKVFNCDLVADFELRGTSRDVTRVYEALINEASKH